NDTISFAKSPGEPRLEIRHRIARPSQRHQNVIAAHIDAEFGIEISYAVHFPLHSRPTHYQNVVPALRAAGSFCTSLAIFFCCSSRSLSSLAARFSHM